MKKFVVPMIFIMFLFMITSEASTMPVKDFPSKSGSNTLAVFFSGDGGWLRIDQVIAENLALKGIHVIGVDSRKYFNVKRTPDETAQDVRYLIDTYSDKLNSRRVILIGYSFGADVIPFIVNRLSKYPDTSLEGAVMISIAGDTTFEVSEDEWSGKIKGEFKTLPEISRVKNVPLLFIGGCDDKTSITQEIDKIKYDVIVTEGGHHFAGNYKYLAGIIIKWCSR